tara:strand:+ start:200 stop:385 length:186 start_codon:yes stop_codon:yes gene_type:complete
MTLQQKIDKAAIKYNETKDPYYKDLWYKLVKEFYGSNISQRRTVPTRFCNKKNDGEYFVIR